jgi:hypothetical protein
MFLRFAREITRVLRHTAIRALAGLSFGSDSPSIAVARTVIYDCQIRLQAFCDDSTLVL